MSGIDNKIQIVAFSTNEKEKSPNEIFSSFLKQHNSLILKKINPAMAFSMTLTGNSKPNIIMICSIFDLTKEYQGLSDVNCYLLFIDLEKEYSSKKLESIITYFKYYCKLDKKIYILGIESGKEGDKKYLTEKDITDIFLDTEQINYEYKGINLSKEKELSDVIMEILIYCSNHPLDEESEDNFEGKGDSGHSSCAIY